MVSLKNFITPKTNCFSFVGDCLLVAFCFLSVCLFETFFLAVYSLTVSVTGTEGTVIPNTTQTAFYGNTKTFTVTPDAGYSAIAGGCGGSPTKSSTSSFTYTTAAVHADCNISVTFTPGFLLTLSLSLSLTSVNALMCDIRWKRD